MNRLSLNQLANLAEVRLQGDQDPSQLSEADRLRYFLYQRQMWLHFQNVWTQWKLGVFPDDIRVGPRHVICDDLVGSSAQMEWWHEAHRYALSEDFALLIESCREKSPA